MSQQGHINRETQPRRCTLIEKVNIASTKREIQYNRHILTEKLYMTGTNKVNTADILTEKFKTTGSTLRNST